MPRLFSRTIPLAFVALAASPLAADAQVRRPKVDVTPIVEAAGGVPAGSTVHLALRVSLPEGLHVQSDAPRDPLLIPTLLTVEPPQGVTVEEIVFPAARDLTQVGQTEPLAVFDHVFVIGVRLAIASSRSPSTLIVPVRLRYQACNDKVCFPPATARSRWTLRVVAPGAARQPLKPRR